MDGWMDGWMMDGWIDGWMDGWMDVNDKNDLNIKWMDGWMDCDFTSFFNSSSVISGRWANHKGCVQSNPVYG